MAGALTLQVIADEIGCSAKTVSNAFSRPDQLSPALRTRILAAAERVGYPGPNPLAAGLRRGRVGAIGFAYANALSYAFEDPTATALLAGISSVAENAGAGLLLVPGSAPDDRNAQAISRAVIDGLVISSLADDDPLLDIALGRPLPTVVIDQPAPDQLRRRIRDGRTRRTAGVPPPAWVGIDDRAAAKEAAAHVLALGHRALGVVSFAVGRTHSRGLLDDRALQAATYSVTRRRLGGYKDAVLDAGLPWSAVPVAAGTDSTVAEGAAAAAVLLARDPRPTAILCLSDRLAQGVIETARARGLRIPHDLSIVGFDDADPAAALGLTTIRQPTRRKGELAATALLNMVNAGRAPSRTPKLRTELVIRSTTAPPAGARQRSVPASHALLGSRSSERPGNRAKD